MRKLSITRRGAPHRASGAALAGAAALALGLAGATACAASAASGTTTTTAALVRASGPFELGPASYRGGSVAVERSGELVVVWDVGSDRTAVCMIRPGARRCSHVTLLRPLLRDSMFGVPEVFAPSPKHVVVLQDTCCDSDPAGGDLLYSSSDGGRRFSAPVRVGTLSVSAATLIGRRIAFTAADDGAGPQVESIPLTASGPPASIATARRKPAFAVAIGQYRGGVLIGSDFLGARVTTTYAEYAPEGSDFNASASYHPVAVFPGEHLLAMSGGALLTVQSGGNRNAVLLRIFTGRGFGPAHVVPHDRGGGPEWFTVFQDPGGRVHVFSERALFRGYHLIEESTSARTRWSPLVDLGDAIHSVVFDAGLDRRGRGLVLGTDPAWAYPVP
jgi:hypothetical protein